MEDLSKLSKEVLTRRLQKFSTELEELKEEQGYVLRQTGSFKYIYSTCFHQRSNSFIFSLGGL